MKQYRPHPSLIAAAQRIHDDGDEWTVTGITTALIQKFRGQGARITEALREDCYQAADIVMEEDRQRAVEAWQDAVELCANE